MALRLRDIISWKRFVLFILAMGVMVAGYSWVYNWPIRFRPKWAAEPHSIVAEHPTSEQPDNIVLTPAGDMARSISVTWRTSVSVEDGVVQFQQQHGKGTGTILEKEAKVTNMSAWELKTDDTYRCFSVILDNLDPGSTYKYRVGSKIRNAWSESTTFTTASEYPATFSFIYMGDTQIKPKRVGVLLDVTEKRHPDAAFYMIGGDLVDNGGRRNLWDSLLAQSKSTFSHKPIAPAMGNHDPGDENFGSYIFNAYFNTPNRNTAQPAIVQNYSFRYGDAHFLVVNQFNVSGQTKWLENELKAADAAGAKFKIVMFHHPVYNPKKHRSNAAAQKEWVPLFDKYKVDLVVSGHDHSYLRTKQLKANKPVAAGEFGTTYIVATGCEKFYKFEKLGVAEKQFTDLATYQLITLDTDVEGVSTLNYRSYSYGDKVLDSFEIIKQ